MRLRSTTGHSPDAVRRFADFAPVPRGDSRPAGSPATLMEFCFPSTREPGRVHSTPVSRPGTFHPQGFSPSRRFTPRPNVRPCFVPVTSMGFALQGFSPAARFRGSSPRNFPHDVSPPQCGIDIITIPVRRHDLPTLRGRRSRLSSSSGRCSSSESVLRIKLLHLGPEPIPS
jgi:hypothetical protein